VNTIVVKKKEIDLIRDFAEPLPLITIVDIMGVSRDDVPQIRKWSLAIGNGFDSLFASEYVLEQQKIALKEFFHYIEDLLKAKKDTKDDKIICSLINAHQKNKLS
jgi:cytochrome P450